MLSLSRPLGRLAFVVGLGLANSAIFLWALLAFAFLPSGAGHIAVAVIMAALLWWWFALHARRFSGAGRSLVWPGGMAAVSFGVFMVSYAIIAALWSVPEVQQEAFRTGGSDYTRHVETSAALLTIGGWLAGWLGAAGAIAVSGLLAIVMGFVALATLAVSTIALMLPARPAPPTADLFRSAPKAMRRG